VVLHPRIAAGSPVGSDWRRLFPCTTDKKHYDDLKTLFTTLDSGSHSNAQGSAAGAEPPLTCDWATERKPPLSPPVRLQPVVRRSYSR
jgi:hypothetical protein